MTEEEGFLLLLAFEVALHINLFQIFGVETGIEHD